MFKENKIHLKTRRLHISNRFIPEYENIFQEYIVIQKIIWYNEFIPEYKKQIPVHRKDEILYDTNSTSRPCFTRHYSL